MPRGDRTGPMGFGPMTGRRAGYCAGYGMPGYANPAPGRGYGFGRGFGWGRGRWAAAGGRWGYYAPPGWVAPAPLSREQEIDLLKAEARDLQEALKQVNERLGSLAGES